MPTIYAGIQRKPGIEVRMRKISGACFGGVVERNTEVMTER